MSSITNTNLNSAVVNVGRTTPVVPGAQPASKSIPVVMASDQTSIPVEEQNKIQSEVALSLLGIPRAEIALGIFADVNTYDVNPSEWSMKPAYHIVGDGVKHLPTEAGALVEASRNKTAVLTSKRFFRYQPGRVSAATFGVKTSVSVSHFAQNPVIRKFGIYDKYDGYYWETRNSGFEDNFAVVRRTQSLQYGPTSPYGIKNLTNLRGEANTNSQTPTKLSNTQLDDYRIVGFGQSESEQSAGLLEADRKILTEKRFELVQGVLDYVTARHNTHLTATGSGGLALSPATTLTGINKGWRHQDPQNTNNYVNNSTTSTTITGSNTMNATSGFYYDLVQAFNASIGYTSGLTPDDMEAKCKRDLDYWIDNFLLDLETGGDAHTRWNSTNFSLADETAGKEWNVPLHDVGVFPKISAFEGPIHRRLLEVITANTVLGLSSGTSSSGKERLVALQTLVATAFGGADDADVSTWNDTFSIMSLDEADIDYGTKDKVETVFDAKRNFWSYFVTTKKAPIALTNGLALVDGKKYTIKAVGQNNAWANIMEGGGTDVYPGRVFEANGNPHSAATGVDGEVYETIEYIGNTAYGTSSSDASGGTSLLPFQGLTETQVKQLIKDKCQRDVGYIIDGYKNDILGGGNAETTYNASMFLRGTGLSVYSQKENNQLSEIQRHTYLKTLMKRELRAFDTADNDTVNYESIHGGASATSGTFVSLANLIVENFDNENTNALSHGKRPFPGNLIVLRDGLIHTHAAVYDPSLLKDKKLIKAEASGGTQSATLASQVATTFKLTEGNVTFGQHVRISWTGTANSIVILNNADPTPDDVIFKNEVLKVRRVLGPKGNEFTATKAVKEEVQAGVFKYKLVTIDLSAANFATDVGTFYFETVVPFIFPNDYSIEALTSNTPPFTSEIDTTFDTLNNDASDGASLADQRVFRTISNELASDLGFIPQGPMFPYMYSKADDLKDTNMGTAGDYIGFVNTALNPNEPSGAVVNTIRSQIDNVNFYPEYVNWIKNNVKPEYWGVYEYRVPRSRFSHDALDGIKNNAADKDHLQPGKRKRVYSDIATGLDENGSNTIVRSGQSFFETAGIPVFQNSEYNFDFTKVTMLKIEFSWYGAVGALFLAYIPVGNGEARWVRVHHLRASNQLKIASLGNATLPITYTTYGGGDQYSLGDGEDVAGVAIEQGYQSFSHHIVKYGASYYIDGGDRGTVRLYSHNNDDLVEARGKQFSPGSGSNITNQAQIGGTGPQVHYINLPTGGSDPDAEFYMGATIKTQNAVDSNVKVVWVDDSNNRAFLSSQLSTVTGLKILPDRARTVFGIETKKTILSTREQNAVRNRVQVYPTKLSSANLTSESPPTPVRLRFKKTPLFQTAFTPATTFTLSADHTIDNTNSPLTTGSSTYMINGDESYGWFRARIGAEFLTVFGRLYRETDAYYFELLESYEGTVVLLSGGTFLADKRFDDTGAQPTGTTKFADELEGLSSVKIATNTVVPIPNTGTNVATTYLQGGTEQFDLATYFDYNKEYLSFPLTDIADTLYFAVDSDTASTNTDSISLGVTWEEQ